MIITPVECLIATQFCKNIIGNIDERHFMSSIVENRSKDRLLNDNLKGKLAEIAVFNLLSIHGFDPTIDFDIYIKSIGDRGDIITSGGIIDVKASSPYARNILVECDRVHSWKVGSVRPDYICMVSIANYDQVCEANYIGGISTDEFLSNAQLIKRNENIPGTNYPIVTDNLCLHKSKCGSVADMIKYLNNHKLNLTE